MSESIIPEPADQFSDEDFQTATSRVRAARQRLLEADAARAAHDALVATIGERVERRRASLAQLRKALGLTQAQMADTLGTDQAEVSKMERRLNHKLATLERFIQATGGALRVSAVYGDVEVELNLGELLSDLPSVDEDVPAKPKRAKPTTKRSAKATVVARRAAAAKKPPVPRSKRREERT
ncbi:MAG: helix-turn-helix transcriptional regulator [Actinobacteria bacterium]|nr:helix-turn-helix transcriptional regulator [Actinomycetota bacterium]